jgi:hypothetical protein
MGYARISSKNKSIKSINQLQVSTLCRRTGHSKSLYAAVCSLYF